MGNKICCSKKNPHNKQKIQQAFTKFSTLVAALSQEFHQKIQKEQTTSMRASQLSNMYKSKKNRSREKLTRALTNTAQNKVIIFSKYRKDLEIIKLEIAENKMNLHYKSQIANVVMPKIEEANKTKAESPAPSPPKPGEPMGFQRQSSQIPHKKIIQDAKVLINAYKLAYPQTAITKRSPMSSQILRQFSSETNASHSTNSGAEFFDYKRKTSIFNSLPKAVQVEEIQLESENEESNPSKEKSKTKVSASGKSRAGNVFFQRKPVS